MSRCEDFPCCGHEAGCCPDFDDAGRQTNMKCTCGATLPLDARSSICDACFRRMDEEEGVLDWDDNEFADEPNEDMDGDNEFADEPNEDMDGDFDSGMASAGFGTDEDYHHYDYGEDSWLDGSYEGE